MSSKQRKGQTGNPVSPSPPAKRRALAARGSKLRICYLAGGEVPGGVGTSLRIHAAVHDRRRYDLCYVWTCPGRTQRAIEGRGFRSRVLPIGRVPSTRVLRDGRARLNPRAFVWIAGTLTAYAPKVARILREWNVDIVYANECFSHLLGGLAGRLAGVPCIWQVRMVISQDLLGGLAAKIYSALGSRLGSEIVCVSEAACRTLSPATSTRRRVMYNRIPDHSAPEGSRIQDLREACGAGPGDVLVGLVCRISEEKGIEDFLGAAARLRERTEVTFALVGGPASPREEAYFRTLQETAASLGLGDRVVFTGFRRDVRDLYHAMDVQCLCSRRPEACPNVVLEGMSAGLPCVVTRGGGQEELIAAPTTGLLYDPGDVAALAEAIRHLASDPERRRRMARAARERFIRRFEISGLMGELESVYSSVLTGQARRMDAGQMGNSRCRAGDSNLAGENR